MSTLFKRVKNNVKTRAVAGELNNTDATISFNVLNGTGSIFDSFPGNSYYVTAWNDRIYPDPGDDPKMRIGLCTARTVDELTVTWGQLGTPVTAIAGTPRVAMLLVDQHLKDIHTAVNTLEAHADDRSLVYIVGLSDALYADYRCGATNHHVTIQSAIDAIEALIAVDGKTRTLKFQQALFDKVKNVVVVTPKYADKIIIDLNGATLKKESNSTSGNGGGGGSKIFGEREPTYSTTLGSDWQTYAYQGSAGFHVKNGILDGNGRNNPSGSPISLNGCQNLRLEDVTIYDGKNFQAFVKGAKGRQILDTDGNNATVTVVRGSLFVSAIGSVDFTTQVSVGDKLRIANTATPTNTNGADTDYPNDSADVVDVTATRLRLRAPYVHQDATPRQLRVFKPNYTESRRLYFENRLDPGETNFATDDSWGGGAMRGFIDGITVINSGGYAIGSTGSGDFIVDHFKLIGGVKAIGTERCYGSTQFGFGYIDGPSSAGLWVVNGNYRIRFHHIEIHGAAGNGIDEKVVAIASDGSTVKRGNEGVKFEDIDVYNSGTHGGRITGDATHLSRVKLFNNGRIATAAGLVLASDTNGGQVTNAPNVTLDDVEIVETRSGVDRTQDYSLWIVDGAGENLSTKNLRMRNAIISETRDDNSTDRLVNYVNTLLNRTDVCMVNVPASAAAAGEPGQIAYDGTHLYVCIALNTWTRAALATW